MRLLVWGVNHRTADLALREKLAFTSEQIATISSQLRLFHAQSQFVFLSTCNRTELYLARPTHAPPSPDQLNQLFANISGITPPQLATVTFVRENEQAVAHLFRVASGLDSMVLGEPQVLGQVRRAYEQADAAGSVGSMLHRIFQQTINVARQVRQQTGIDQGRLSIGSVATEFAKRIFDRFDDKTVLAIGAGEMAKLTLKHLLDLNPGKLRLINRTPQRAQLLAQTLALPASTTSVASWDDLDSLLIQADIVITSTAATQPIITVQQFKPLLRRRRGRPLFIIDLAVPRDVEPAVAGLSNIFLYNIDDLQHVTAQTRLDRAAQVEQAETIVQQQARACLEDLQHQDLGQLIRELREKINSLASAEHQRTLRKLSAAKPDDLPNLTPQLLEEHTHRLVNKILHLPLSQIEHRQPGVTLGFYVLALRRLFGLENDLPHLTKPDTPDHPPTASASDSTPSITTSQTPSSHPANQPHHHA